MDIIKLLEYLQDIIETAAKVPLTGKVMIDKDEVLKVIDEITNYLPDEFKKAQWVCEEKDRILEDAIKKAEIIKQQRLQHLKSDIENHDITKEATIMAQGIVSSAKRDAQDMRLGAKEYADEVLCQLQDEIDRLGKEMLANVEKELKDFMINMDNSIANTSSSIKENVKELRNMK